MTGPINHEYIQAVFGSGAIDVHQLIDAMPHMVWIASQERGCEFASRRWEEYTGVSAQALLGFDWLELIHPDDRELTVSAWNRSSTQGTPLEVTARMRRHDGEYRWLDTRGVPLKDKEGKIYKWFGTNTEVHDSILAREKLAANEERLRYVELATHDAIYDWDMKAGITHRNEEFQNVYGSPPTTRVEERWWQYRIHPDDYRRVMDSANAAVRARSPTWNSEYRFKRADGTYSNVIDRGYLLYDADQKPSRLIGAMADITAIKQVEQSLRDSQDRLLSAMEAGGLATWIWDLKTNELLWDEATWRLWGQPPGTYERFELPNLRPLIHPDDLPRLIESTAEFRRTGIEVPVELRTIRPDGALQWLLAKGRVQRDASGHVVRMAGVYIDITQRKQMEESALRTQKMEALGTLAGGIAHDFNNILLAIVGNAKLAMEDLHAIAPIEHPIRRSLVEIDRAAARATDLVRRILTFSRQQEAHRQSVQLRPIVDDALRLLRPTLPVSIEIRTTYSVDAPSVATDAIQIQQVVMNLVTNATHAIGEGRGVVEIALSSATFNENQERPALLPPGLYAVLSVSDSGPGIDADILDRIFDPFFTTKPTGQGTGLGLAVVHGIVRSHDGAIEVRNEFGKGAIFSVYLPAAPHAAVAIESPIAPLVQGAGERIMYVDDEEPLVFLISRVLERLGYGVSGWLDPEKALAELRANPNRYDVLVTDLSMRGMNGFEFTRAARAVRADLPVLLTSGYVRTEDRVLAEQCGIRQVILKPNTVEELGEAIARELRAIKT